MDYFVYNALNWHDVQHYQKIGPTIIIALINVGVELTGKFIKTY